MRVVTLVLSVLALAGACARTESITLSFDDIPAGSPLMLYTQYGVWFSGAFEVADHSASTWGPPRSGSNVLINHWSTPLSSGAMVKFGYQQGGWGGELVLTSIRSFGGYFSTQPDVVVQIVGLYNDIHHPLASAVVGAVGESWSNRYVEISSPAGNIDFVMFYNVSSDDALFHYCADDVTVEFVPEPSSLAALGLGLMGLSPVLVRRRRER